MPSLTCFKFRFTPSWLMIILFSLFFALFVRLGWWQIHRAHEKNQMIAAQNTQQTLNPTNWNTKEKPPLQYARIILQGQYLPQIFLLDNQHYNHQFGYDVLSPLELSDGSIVLIDRGWVPAQMNRQALPNIDVSSKSLKVQGSVYFPSKNIWVLGPVLEKKNSKMIILERIDEQLISQILQKSVSPFIIRLDKHDPDGFVREWKVVSMPPERHLAYAFQWFVMALVVLIIFIALNLKKKNDKTIQ